MKAQSKKTSLHLVGGVGVVEVELGGAEHAHDGVEDTELTGSEGTDHDATGAEASHAELGEPELLGDVYQAGNGATIATGALLVDLGQEGIW